MEETVFVCLGLYLEGKLTEERSAFGMWVSQVGGNFRVRNTSVGSVLGSLSCMMQHCRLNLPLIFW